MSLCLIGEASLILNGSLVDDQVNLCSGKLDTQLDHEALEWADLGNMRSLPKQQIFRVGLKRNLEFWIVVLHAPQLSIGQRMDTS